MLMQLKLITMSGIITLFTFLLIAFFSGDNQQLTIRCIEEKLCKGISPEETVYRLGFGNDSPELLRNDDRFYLVLSKPGIGSWLNAQHQITLIYDSSKHLVDGNIEWHFKISEDYQDLTLSTECLNP